MSAVSLPVTRPVGRALVVAHASGRASVLEMLSNLGFESGECDDPYAAMLELARRRQAYRAVIISLASVFREELGFITAVKRRFPQVEIWLTHTDGRQAALAESMRLGADGLFDDHGLHRIAIAGPAQQPIYQPLSEVSPAPTFQELAADEPAAETRNAEPDDGSTGFSEPVLSADELRALLQEQPVMPPSGTMEDDQ